MIALNSNSNIDNSDLINYPDGRIKDNDGTDNGTPINRSVYGDLHSTISKLMRLYAIVPNGLPDNETNGYQIIDALSALASKNDFIYPLSTNGTLLNVNIKLSSMKESEFIVCLAGFDKGSETQITGLGSGTFAISYSGSFKANEYVRIIKTSLGFSIIRLADALSLNAMVTELLFLKKATQTEENAGTIDTKATTPLSNLTAFIKRVIGSDSGNYLAKPLGDVDERNGLLSKQDKKKLDDFDETIIGTGSVLSSGTKLTERKISFTSTRVSEGNYLITHNLGFSNYAVAGSGTTNNRLKLSIYNRTNTSCIIEVSDDDSPNDGDFAFMLFKL